MVSLGLQKLFSAHRTLSFSERESLSEALSVKNVAAFRLSSTLHFVDTDGTQRALFHVQLFVPPGIHDGEHLENFLFPRNLLVIFFLQAFEGNFDVGEDASQAYHGGL